MFANASVFCCISVHVQLCLLEHGPLTSLSLLDTISFAGGVHSWPDVHAERRLRERRAAGGERGSAAERGRERAFWILCSVREEPPSWMSSLAKTLYLKEKE